MSSTLDPQLKRALADRIRYYNELGIYDFYRRDFYRCETTVQIQPEEREPLPRAKAAAATSHSRSWSKSPPQPESAPCGPCPGAARHSRRHRRLHPLPPGQAGTQADRLRRGQSAGGVDVHRRSAGRRRRPAGRALRGPRRTVAQQHDQGHGPAPRRCLYREHHQVPAAGQPHAGTRRVRNLLAVSDAADCDDQAQS